MRRTRRESRIYAGTLRFCRKSAAFRLIAVISTARLSDLLRRSYLPLAAISGIIAFLPAFAGAYIDYYKRSPKSRLYTKFLQNFCTSLQNCCEAPPPPPAQAKAAADIPPTLLIYRAASRLELQFQSNLPLAARIPWMHLPAVCIARRPLSLFRRRAAIQ